MGGFGSGARWSKKAVVESKYCIDVMDFKRWKLLVPGITNQLGSLQWSRGSDKTPSASIGYILTVGKTNGTLRLMYRLPATETDLDYSIPLVTTPCHLGGVRWWFICPLVVNGIECGGRVRKLYLDGKYFGCRRCHRLTYTSCQESDSRAYALLRAGLHRMGDPAGMSITQLGIALKAFKLSEKRFARLGLD